MTRSLLAALLLGLSALAAAQTSPLGPALTPAQTAAYRTDVARADDLFVRRVVAITQMPHDVVRRAIPAEGRITEPSARIAASIERDSGKALSDDQKAAIRAAVEDRRQMVANARSRAGLK